jgi:hypothetical protein
MAKDITRYIDRYEHAPEVTTREWLEGDYCYFQLMRTADEAVRFNYHDDYWGDADEYQEQNVCLMRDLEPWVGERCRAYIDGDCIEGTLEGILVDRQYNSIGHTCVLFGDVKEVK